MICCAALSILLVALIGLKNRLFPASNSCQTALAWRLDGLCDDVPASSRFSVVARWRSFQYAGAGLHHLLQHEHNARIHALAGLAVLIVGILLGISPSDWRWLVVAVAMVIAAEALNTAIERLCDLISPGPHELVRIAKDAAAAAVLVLAIGAAIIGLLTFAPYLAAAAGRISGSNFPICR